MQMRPPLIADRDLCGLLVRVGEESVQGSAVVAGALDARAGLGGICAFGLRPDDADLVIGDDVAVEGVQGGFGDGGVRVRGEGGEVGEEEGVEGVGVDAGGGGADVVDEAGELGGVVVLVEDEREVGERLAVDDRDVGLWLRKAREGVWTGSFVGSQVDGLGVGGKVEHGGEYRFEHFSLLFLRDFMLVHRDEKADEGGGVVGKPFQYGENTSMFSLSL